MKSARTVSKHIDRELFEHYSTGALVPHIAAGVTYTSTPDSEAVIASINSAQNADVIMEQLDDLISRPRLYGRTSVTINNIKFSWPHRMNKHDTPPPHPSMEDDDLRAYIWPNASLNRSSMGNLSSSYTATVWVDIGESDVQLTPIDGIYTGFGVRAERWVSILDWPVMVGSNVCNLAIMRSYLSDPDYAERTQYILDHIVKYDDGVPDGHYIISGKLKRMAIVDRILMNMTYVVKSPEYIPSPFGGEGARIRAVGHMISEVRSIRSGISYHQMIMAYDKSGDGVKGVDMDVYRTYGAIVMMNARSLLPVPINVINIARLYAHVVLDMDNMRAIEIFRDELMNLADNDQEIARIFSLTETNAMNDDINALEAEMRTLLLRNPDDSLSDAIIDVIMPHCNYGEDLEDNFYAKVRVMSMMFINLVASVIPGTSIGEVGPTDRKDFSYKRWEAPGQQMKDFLRNYLRFNIDLAKPSTPKDAMISTMRQNKWAVKYVSNPRADNNDILDGVVDDVAAYNVASMIDSIRTVKINAKAGGNTGAARRIHTSQWGAQCVANTPENNNIGLINNLAEAVLISEDLTRSEMMALEEEIDALLGSPAGIGEYMFIVDGAPRAWVSDEVYDELRLARQEGRINRGIGLAIHRMWDRVPVIVVRTSHGRPIIPVIRIDNDEDKLDDILRPGSDILNMNMNAMLREGIVEYIDSYEMSWSSVVAEWLYTRGRDGQFTPIDASKYTHAMIKPGYILSQVSNTLSFIEHNPAARGTYATVHVKQAIGRPYKYEKDRFDNDTNYLMNPQASLLLTDTARRLGMDKVGIGRNVRIACMSYDSNRDDAILFSERLASSGALDGYHYNIFRSERGMTSFNRYNWLTQEMPSGDIVELRGLIDPDFSDSVILPYGDPHIVEVTELPDIDEDGLYEVEEGLRYRLWGTYRKVIITYDDGSVREISPGTEAYDIPGKTRVSTTRAPITYRLALAMVDDDWREKILTGREEGFGLGWHDTPFISMDDEWHGPVEAVVPRIIDGDNMGTLDIIYPRRRIIRGDVATMLIERSDTGISEIQKERFDITYGYIDGIERGSSIRIKGAMPIGPKAGNKYAALYAQKNINVGIIPSDRMPIARWVNDVTGEEEELEFDIVFNPLSFPSRMTMGMILEIFISGTVDYIYNLKDNDGTPLRYLYENDREAFDDHMYETYGIDEASDLLDEITDVTPFMYDNDEKVEQVRDIRERLGIPVNAEYNITIGDEVITNPIFCGTVHYVALRHLVDNKRRARGYVGRRDPVTYQPVKGRRRDGGASTGLQEKDAYAAHGASAILHERMATTSDAIRLLKCMNCGGLATKRGTEYICMDCNTVVPPSEIARINTVWSYQLLTYYLRAMGANLTETYK